MRTNGQITFNPSFQQLRMQTPVRGVLRLSYLTSPIEIDYQEPTPITEDVDIPQVAMHEASSMQPRHEIPYFVLLFRRANLLRTRYPLHRDPVPIPRKSLVSEKFGSVSKLEAMLVELRAVFASKLDEDQSAGWDHVGEEQVAIGLSTILGVERVNGKVNGPIDPGQLGNWGEEQ
jgi:hypothetical protein